MSRLDFRRGYLRVPLAVWLTVFCRPLLTRRQFQLVSVVIRESWGWQTRGGEPQLWTKPLTSRDFAQATGLSTDHLRRDLRRLIARGVLREQTGRYQFVSEPRLWRTLPAPAPEARPLPPESTASPAVLAAGSPGLNKQTKVKDNGPASPGPVSPPVENSSSSPASVAFGAVAAATPPLVGERVVGTERAADSERVVGSERVADIVAAFVGSLTSGQADALRRWVCAEGVAGVWDALEPAFRQGPLVARRALLAALAARTGSEEPLRRVERTFPEEERIFSEEEPPLRGEEPGD